MGVNTYSKFINHKPSLKRQTCKEQETVAERDMQALMSSLAPFEIEDEKSWKTKKSSKNLRKNYFRFRTKLTNARKNGKNLWKITRSNC